MDQILARLSQGPGNLQQNDYEDWNQMVGAAPPEQFGRATYDSITQVDPDEYSRHVTPGVDGTDPIGSLAPQQRTGLAQTLLGELMRRGMGKQDIAQGAGLSDVNPNNMSPMDLASLLQFVQRKEPKAYGRVAAQYQDQPDILQSLLGNKALMSIAATIGTKFITDQLGKRMGGFGR